MIKTIPVWTNNPRQHIQEIVEDHANIESVVFNTLNEIKFNLIGGDLTFFDDCIEVCNKYNIPILLLTTFCREFNEKQIDEINPLYRNLKIIHWPSYWFFRTYHYMVTNQEGYSENIKLGLDITDNAVNLNKYRINHLYITMNHLAKDHRCMMMDMLAKYDLIDKGAIAWWDSLRYPDHVRAEIPEGMTDSEYCGLHGGYQFKYWKPRQMLLDQTGRFSNQEKLPKEYTNSFIQVVTESDSDLFFISEKTCVPLIFNQLFLVHGARYFHKYLEQFGFKLYDELFDYSFDNCESVLERAAGIAENVAKYASYTESELLSILESVKQKIQYNRIRAVELAIKEFPNEVQQSVDAKIIRPSDFMDINTLVQSIL